MENVWNGVFAPIEPTLQKSVGSSRFIPLLEMTRDDWKVFDWDNISDKAKNALVEKALREPIVGFVHYLFVEKGSKANGYYAAVGESELPTDFLNRPEFQNHGLTDSSPNPKTIEFNNIVTDLAASRTIIAKDDWIKLLAAALAKVLKDQHDTEKTRKFNEDMLNKINDGDFADIEELDYCLTWALGVLHEIEIEGLQEWADDAEQIVGDAEDNNLI
jgi:hypothetical protein